MAGVVKLYENKLTEAPSVCVGAITVDFGQDETPAQAKLIEAITNHPDAVLQNELCVPLNEELTAAFLEVVNEEVRTDTKTRAKIKHQVKVAKS